MRIAAAILAGGASTRFGADKTMARLRNDPLVAYVARALRVEASALAVVGHRAGAQCAGAIGLTDPSDAVRGPLAGVLAALDWATEIGADWLVTAPCDAPLLPHTLASDLVAAAEDAGAAAALARTRTGLHPLCAAWRPALAERLRSCFLAGIHPPVRDFAPDAVHVMFEDENAFLNVNTPADLARAAALLGEA